MDEDKRRLDELNFEALGLTKAQISKQVSQKYTCSKRIVYNDLKTRSEWQPILCSTIKPEDVLLKVVNRNDFIYRQASLRLLSSTNPLVQLSALNLMLKVNCLIYESVVLPEILAKLKALEEKAKRGVFLP